MTNEYQIRLVDRMAVNELVTENPDGTYTILINGDLCESKRAKAVAHALWHIQNNDFERSDVQNIETEAHNESGTI